MTEPDAMTENDLHAYVDGRLDAAAQRRVDAWLAEHPEDAATVHAYRLQNSGIHAAFDPVVEEGVPPAMDALVHRRSRRVRTAGWPWLRLAASVALLLAGGVAGWFLHGAQNPSAIGPAETFADQAIGAHRIFVAEVRHPVEVRADQEAHLVAWLSKRLNTKLRAPDLRGSGYSLVGGRLLAEGAKPAAQFMYEEPDGQRITVYVRAFDGGSDTAFHFISHKGVSAFYWIDKSFAYALVAPMNREKLLTIAQKVYDDLDRR
jgi:anti-sigma factor RsiW